MQYLKIKNKMIGAGKPKICVPIVAKNEAEIDIQLQEILDNEVDIVEFRGDYFEGLADMDRLSKLLSRLQERLQEVILLFTIRSEAEGGEKLGFKEPCVNDINEYVIQNKLADIVDLEFFSGEERVSELCELAKEKGVSIIMSNHDFNTTPDIEEMLNRLCRMQELGADIAKLAVMPENKLQIMDLLKATVVMSGQYAKVPIVTMSMGKNGAVSRITGQIFGSAITFACLENASAPGQIELEDMKNALRFVDTYCSE